MTSIRLTQKCDPVPLRPDVSLFSVFVSELGKGESLRRRRCSSVISNFRVSRGIPIGVYRAGLGGISDPEFKKCTLWEHRQPGLNRLVWGTHSYFGIRQRVRIKGSTWFENATSYWVRFENSTLISCFSRCGGL